MRDELGVRHRVDEQGVVHVVFDRPGDKLNVLTAAILEHLGQLLDEVARREDVRGVVFSSAKKGCFIAGMDVEAIAAVTDPFQAAEGARRGQAIFQKIADLPVPSVAAIAGTCLGGGLEMSLACTLRIASDAKAVSIGLPETQIGIIPGFGGTQRLPRLIGLLPSLDLILAGKRLDGRRAEKLGVVDRVVPDALLEREAVKLLLGHASFRRARRRPAWQVAAERLGPARRFLIEQARRKTAAKVSPEAYPAPFRALESVEAAYSMELPQGLDVEARIVGELVPTPTSKNLMWLFKSQSALKKTDGSGAPPRRVRRAAVLGAGIMGGGIAQLLADRDLPVRLKDIRYEAVLTALQTASKVWSERVRRRRMTPREAARKAAFIAPTLDGTGFSRVDVVIEAVVENLAVKQKVLAEIEARIGERAVFASNTSTLPISDIASQARRPERVVGMHFFNPVHRMPLVEIIAGQRTSPEAVATVQALAVELGKVPVVVRDAPGFLVNRILMLYLNEAMRLLGEGVSIEAADRAMVAFGMPMGPFTLLDEIGLDTANHAGGVLEGAFGKRIGGGGQLLAQVVQTGRLGAKNGRGFYRYRDRRRAGPDPEVVRMAGAPGPRELPVETLQERMVLAMVNEAAVCLEDAVVREPRDLDLAMVMGTGFPPFRGGLLRYADAVGIPVVTDRLARLADAQGERFRPAPLLRDLVRGEGRFYPVG